MKWLACLAVVGVLSCERGDSSSKMTVFAAASLTDAFDELEREFEETHTCDVVINYAGSQVLRMQLENGANADVFASADTAHMEALERAHWVENPAPFVRNELVIITPKDNPAHIEVFEDLTNAKRFVIGTKNVPFGRYTRQMLARAIPDVAALSDLESHVVSEETNVRLARAKVVMGEADASVVYRTDAMGAPVREVVIPPAYNVVATYPIARLTRAKDKAAADEFIRFVQSSRGQQVLSKHGFLRGDAP